jgi:spermidine synthase
MRGRKAQGCIIEILVSAMENSEMRMGGSVKGRVYLDLFLISFLILFFELACIRWFGSMVVFLTFFTNVILLATFLGMSVGCLSASGRRDMTGLVTPLLLVAAVAAFATLKVHGIWSRLLIDVGGQGSPQQIYFGTEYRAYDLSAFVIPVELVAVVFFTLVALVFVGMGQVMGRAFNSATDRLKAYTVNISGSLAGIAVFSAASYLRTTPLAWFAIALAIWLYFLKRWSAVQIFSVLAAIILAGFTAYNATLFSAYEKNRDYWVTYWSPYYKIQYNPRDLSILTNNIGHQKMMDRAEETPSYALAHLLNRDSGGKPFEDVLVIGAGSGNDVAAALAYGAKHVDAVEIDPAIYDTGRVNHPERPYDDPRVTIHIDDGRSFLRNSTGKYDLVVYALVDSLVLQSGYSSIRLESFLFTDQAFDDIRARLKPDGTFVVYNFMRQGWLVGRLARMMQRSFGAEPLVLSLPYRESILPSDPQTNTISCFVNGSNNSARGNIRRKFDEVGNFWLPKKVALNQTIQNGFSPQPPADAPQGDWLRIAPARLVIEDNVRFSTDDWPFLYLRYQTIPWLNLREMILLAIASVAILLAFSPVKRVRPNGQMFFLGAGFMLLETKGVVHVALLFGSTWIVNSVVFFAILLFILIANLYVWAVRPVRLWPYYVLLSAALVVNIVIPMSTFLALPGWEKVAASCAVVFAPIFFAGIIFATSFRASQNPDIDFGSNIAGAVLGGLCENFSLVLGFNYLLVLAVVFYVISSVLRGRKGSLPALQVGG